MTERKISMAPELGMPYGNVTPIKKDIETMRGAAVRAYLTGDRETLADLNAASRIEQHIDRITERLDRVNQHNILLARALVDAARQFLKYAEMHMAKEPPDKSKAQTNIEWARRCAQAVIAANKEQVTGGIYGVDNSVTNGEKS